MTPSAHIAAADYVRRHCIPRAELARAVGGSAGDLQQLVDAGVVPEATYRVTATAVVSAIGAVGAISPDEPSQDYFGPSVAMWLRRALVLADGDCGAGLSETLQAWLTGDLAAALAARPGEAKAYGWNHVMRDGGIDPMAVRREVDSYWPGWMRGGWAVCLRRFDGHHLATKEIERCRIADLDSGEGRLSPVRRLALLDAIDRLDAVLLPFAPHERPSGTPGQFIDGPVRRRGLPWPLPEVATG
jgi:hypothetical protein